MVTLNDVKSGTCWIVPPEASCMGASLIYLIQILEDPEPRGDGYWIAKVKEAYYYTKYPHISKPGIVNSWQLPASYNLDKMIPISKDQFEAMYDLLEPNYPVD